MKKVCITILALCSFILSAGEFKGPFLAEALAFYFVHDGGPLKLSLKVSVDGYHKDNPLYLQRDGAFVGRIFDVEEKLVEWDYRKLKAGITETISHDFGKNAPAGIYQIRYSGANVKVLPSAVPQKKFGVLAMRCKIYPTIPDQFGDTYFYVPENAAKLSITTYGKKPELRDAENNPVARLKDLDLSKKHKEIWRFSVKARTPFGFESSQPILCPDKETASRIKDSLERASNGTLYAHKFQVRIHDWIERAKKENLTVEPVDLRKYIPELDKDPAAYGLVGNRGLLHYLNDMIAKQNLDSASGDFGSTPYPNALAFAYGVNKPYNPYYLNTAMEKRMLIPAMKRFLQITESDALWPGSNPYNGSDALVFVKESSLYMFEEAYHAVKDAEAKELWYEAIRRIPDRFSMFRVSCDNQSSLWPVIYESLYQTAGNKKYQEMAQDFIHGMTQAGGDPFIKTGYLQEGGGADGSYSGLCACNLALYYRMSGNPEAKDLLRTIYNFYSHTVAPEPGKPNVIFGTSSYASRTCPPWTKRQYRGGMPLMKGVLPEASFWSPDQPHKPAGQLLRQRKCDGGEKYATASWGEYYSDFKYRSVSIPPAQLPMVAGDNFVHNFNNEFLAVRKPDYYALVYAGRTIPEWTGVRRKKDPYKYHFVKNGNWSVIQGLCMLWSPDFGNFVLGMNWNGDTGNFLRADFENGECAFPDYWSFNSKLSDEAVEMHADMFNLKGVSFDRTIRFLPHGIACNIAVHVKEDVKVKALYEQLPLLMEEKRLNFEFLVDGKWRKTPGIASQVRGNNRVLITLNPALPCTFCPESRLYDQKMGGLRFHLPSKSLKAGQTIRLSYTIEFLKK